MLERELPLKCPKCERQPRDSMLGEMHKCTKCGHVFVPRPSSPDLVIEKYATFVVTDAIKEKYRKMAERNRPKKSIPRDTEVLVTGCTNCKQVISITRTLEDEYGQKERRIGYLEKSKCYNCGEAAEIKINEGRLDEMRAAYKKYNYRWLD